MRLKDKVAIITGAGSGFGAGIAQRSGPTRLDSSGGVYKCNPGGLRVIHGAARVAHATHTSARRGG